MYAVVDLETTGSHPSHDNIIEIAVYLHDGDSVTDQFCSLLNPGHPIPPGALPFRAGCAFFSQQVALTHGGGNYDGFEVVWVVSPGKTIRQLASAGDRATIRWCC
ncbi:MAG: exonuclease domain-containing protein, partial [Bacteroidota bacterium]